MAPETARASFAGDPIVGCIDFSGECETFAPGFLDPAAGGSGATAVIAVLATEFVADPGQDGHDQIRIDVGNDRITVTRAGLQVGNAYPAYDLEIRDLDWSGDSGQIQSVTLLESAGLPVDSISFGPDSIRISLGSIAAGGPGPIRTATWGIGAAPARCGDVDQNGAVGSADVARLRAALAFAPPPLSLAEELRCNVEIDSVLPGASTISQAFANDCSVLDVTITTRGLAALDPGADEVCPAGSTEECCRAHPGVGCNETSVIGCVCGLDPSCCAESWDAACGLIAKQSCAPAMCDEDGDGIRVADGDCNDQDAEIRPGATELCNGVDDDCNDTVDNGCCTNVVVDGGFEAGSPWPAWGQFSTNFGTPICDVASCTTGGTGPGAGGWWFWGGGYDGGTEISWVEQSLAIPAYAAGLEFYLAIPNCASLGSDRFLVLIDGIQVFTANRSDPSCGSTSYTQRFVDLSAHANGSPHVLRFRSETFGLGTGVTSFMLDDVAINACIP